MQTIEDFVQQLKVSGLLPNKKNVSRKFGVNFLFHFPEFMCKRGSKETQVIDLNE